MEILLFLAGTSIGVMLGIVAARSRGSSRLAIAEERGRRLEQDVLAITEERNRARSDREELQQKSTYIRAQLEQLQSNDVRLTATFEKLSRDALKSSSEELLRTAEQSFKLAQEQQRSDLDKQRLKIEHLVNPVQEHLTKLETHIQQTESQRKAEYGSLFEHLRNVAETNRRVEDEARQLKNVLRSSGSQRGRWGEVQLRRVVELAGMLEHCDFTEQVTSSTSSETGTRIARADLVISLPYRQQIAVDAKVPYDSYEAAQSTEDVAVQKQRLTEHAVAVKKHVEALASRKYWDVYTPSPGFSVLFVPGEALLDAALTQDANLWEFAAERHILLATPSTLIALLRMAALGWRQQSQAENAERIASTGRELYERLIVAGRHLAKVRSGLEGAVDSYNKFVGSMESRVFPSARKLSALGVSTNELPEQEEIVKHPRTLDEGVLELPDSSATLSSKKPGRSALATNVESDALFSEGLATVELDRKVESDAENTSPDPATPDADLSDDPGAQKAESVAKSQPK